MPWRPWVKKRLTELWNYERFEAPVKAGANYFFMRNDGKQNQSVLYVTDDLKSNGRVLFDPNTASAGFHDCPLGFHAEPGRQPAGLRALGRRHGLADLEISRRERRKGSRPTRSAAPNSGASRGRAITPASTTASILRARMAKAMTRAGPTSTSTSSASRRQQDRLIYKVTDHPTRVPQAHVTEDGRYLILTLIGWQSREWRRCDGARQSPLPKRSRLFAAVGRALQLRRLEGR